MAPEKCLSSLNSSTQLLPVFLLTNFIHALAYSIIFNRLVLLVHQLRVCLEVLLQLSINKLRPLVETSVLF